MPPKASFWGQIFSGVQGSLTTRDHAKQTGVALEKAYQFVLWLIPTVERLPRSHKFLLGDRIQTTALDMIGGIVEATYSRNRTPVLRRVNLSLEKLRLLFRLSMDLKYIDMRRYEHASRSIDEIGRLIGGWLKKSHELRWNYGDGFPVTLRFADDVGEILTAIPELNSKPLPFRHYI